MRAIHLVESPQKVLGRAVHVVAARVVGEIVDQGRATELLTEKINLVEEEDDAGPHEPSRVHYRIEENKTFHHTVLHVSVSRASKTIFREGGYLVASLQKNLIVFAESDAEYN